MTVSLKYLRRDVNLPVQSLVCEVNFALRYFEDAVVKATYEMLPGCATVVLETVVNLQNYTVTKVSVIASRYTQYGL